MINVNLKRSFQFHLRGVIRRPYGDTTPRALLALKLARDDMESNKVRYPGPMKTHAPTGLCSDGMTYVDDPDSVGLRLVGKVMSQSGYRSVLWQRQDDESGWYTDPDQHGFAYGVVYQLTGHNGQNRFVAGYVFGDADGLNLDLSRVFSEPADDENPRESSAARSAAIYADDMAKRAAESERKYQCAWRSGSLWARYAQDVKDDKTTLRELLAERRKAKSIDGFPSICAAIDRQAKSIIGDIRKAKSRMKTLKEGDHAEYGFYTGEKRLREAFCEGADLETFPA